MKSPVIHTPLPALVLMTHAMHCLAHIVVLQGQGWAPALVVKEGAVVVDARCPCARPGKTLLVPALTQAQMLSKTRQHKANPHAASMSSGPHQAPKSRLPASPQA